MKLLIVSPEYQEKYEVDWLQVQTPKGSLMLLPGHAPMVVTLVAPSEFSFLLRSGETKTIQLIRAGFLEIDRVSATALINQGNL